jgi:hypothetical protein
MRRSRTETWKAFSNGLAVVAAARLAEGVPDETDDLLAISSAPIFYFRPLTSLDAAIRELSSRIARSRSVRNRLTPFDACPL